MGTFPQWVAKPLRLKRKMRVLWVGGTERQLREEVAREFVALRRARVFVIHKDALSDDDVWTAAFQERADADSSVILVRGAQDIKDWQFLLEWSPRADPRLSFALISEEKDPPSADTDVGKALRTRPSWGFVVCRELTLLDAMRWAKSKHPGLSAGSAEHLIMRSGGDLHLAAMALRKLLAVSREDPPLKVIDEMLDEPSFEGFVEALLHDRRAEALSHKDMSNDELAEALSLLTARLCLLEALHGCHRASLRDLQERTGAPAILILRYRDISPRFDMGRVTHLRSLVARADQALQSGVSVGVVEMLVSLW